MSRLPDNSDAFEAIDPAEAVPSPDEAVDDSVRRPDRPATETLLDPEADR